MVAPPDDGPRRADLLRWSEALSGIARTGLGFTQSLYEKERYEEILKVAADIRACAEEAALAEPAGSGGVSRPAGSGGVSRPAGSGGVSRPAGSGGVSRPAGSGGRSQAYEAEWLRGVGSGVPGYVTPKVAVGAVVGDDQGRLLLVQRADSGVWLYPTGWADIGYSPAEVAVKEVHEETGITCDPVRLIAVLDGLRLGFTSVPLYSLVFHCRATGGELAAHPLETRDVGWFAEDGLPSPLAGFERWGAKAFAAIRGEPVDVLFDPVRDPIWRDDA